MNKIFETIDSLREDYIKVWEDVCSIDSPTDFKEGVDAVGNYYADMAKKRGWNVERLKMPRSGDVVCITMNADSKSAPVALSGHMDTVFPVGMFSVSRDDQKIYGPGVCDCKGGTVIAFLAMDALYRCGYKDRPVMLLLQSDEECGSSLSEKQTINYICEKAKDAVCFFNMEGHKNECVCVQRKGIISYKFNVKGIAAHSSKCATQGANAIVEAAHKILRLETLKDEEGITCNCGVISGGTVRNTVAEECTFTADIRYATAAQLEYAKAFVQQVANETTVNGCSCEAVMASFRTAMERTDRNLELLDKINGIFKSVGMSEFSPSARAGGSDAADVTAHGIPCLDNFGAEGDNIHSVKEFAYLSSLTEHAKRVAAIIKNII